MEAETIAKNYAKWLELVKKTFGEEVASKLDDVYGERICLCPMDLASSPGALIDWSLRVASEIKKLDAYGSVRSLVRVALIHELGRIGDAENELYVPQKEQWRIDKLGQQFSYNEKCPKVLMSHRTLMVLQDVGAKLTRDEWVAVATSQGTHLEESRFYGNCLPLLAVALQASRALCQQHI